MNTTPHPRFSQVTITGRNTSNAHRADVYEGLMRGSDFCYVISEKALSPGQQISIDTLSEEFGSAAIGRYKTYRYTAARRTNPLDAGRSLVMG